MKLIFIFGIIMCLSSALMSYLFYQRSSVKKEDLIQHEGIIANMPTFSRDEYDNYNTGMRFHLEGEEYPISIPGKLLREADQRIEKLQKGERVYFYEKKKEAMSMLDNKVRIAFGLSTEEVSFYSKEDALTFFQGPQTRIPAFTLLLLSLTILFLLLRGLRSYLYV